MKIIKLLIATISFFAFKCYSADTYGYIVFLYSTPLELIHRTETSNIIQLSKEDSHFIYNKNLEYLSGANPWISTYQRHKDEVFLNYEFPKNVNGNDNIHNALINKFNLIQNVKNGELLFDYKIDEFPAQEVSEYITIPIALENKKTIYEWISRTEPLFPQTAIFLLKGTIFKISSGPHTVQGIKIILKPNQVRYFYIANTVNRQADSKNTPRPSIRYYNMRSEYKKMQYDEYVEYLKEEFSTYDIPEFEDLDVKIHKLGQNLSSYL
jgi:hypothetical protein